LTCPGRITEKGGWAKKTLGEGGLKGVDGTITAPTGSCSGVGRKRKGGKGGAGEGVGRRIKCKGSSPTKGFRNFGGGSRGRRGNRATGTEQGRRR